MKLADVNMEKMNPLLQNLIAYTSHDIVFECKNQEELEESLKSTIFDDYEERIAQAYIDHACEEEKTIGQDKEDMFLNYGQYAGEGFGIFIADDFPLEHIEKIDELDIFDSDLEASQYAELLGVKIAHDIVFDENSPYYYYNDTILDTEQNRRLYEQMKAEGDI
jgi:hypothetical protein